MAVTDYQILVDGAACVDPDTLAEHAQHLGLPTPWRGSANGITLPSGARAGKLHFLLPYRDIKAKLADFTHTVTVDYGNERLTLEDVVFEDVRSTVSSAEVTDESVVHVIARDQRFLLTLSTCNKQYNITATEETGPYWTDTTNGGTPWNWKDMLEDIWGQAAPMSTVLVFDPDPFPANTLPENYDFRGVTVTEAMERVLNDIGLTLLYELTANVFQVVQRGDVNTEDQNALSGAYRDGWRDTAIDVSPHLTRVAEELEVFFPDRDYQYQQGATDLIAPGDRFTTEGVHSIVVPTNYSTVIPSTKVPWWSPTPVVRDNAGAIQNTTQLQSIANTMRDIYVRSRGNTEQIDEVFSGLHQINPSGFVSQVAWYDIGGRQGLNTSVKYEIGTTRNRANPAVAKRHAPYERFAIGDTSGEAAPSGTATMAVEHYSGSWASSARNITVRNAHTTSTAPAGRYKAFYNWQSNEWNILPRQSGSAAAIFAEGRRTFPDTNPWDDDEIPFDRTTVRGVGEILDGSSNTIRFRILTPGVYHISCTVTICGWADPRPTTGSTSSGRNHLIIYRNAGSWDSALRTDVDVIEYPTDRGRADNNVSTTQIMALNDEISFFIETPNKVGSPTHGDNGVIIAHCEISYEGTGV